MKHRVLLSMLLALGCVHVHGAPTEQNAMEPGSCKDAQALVAADLALAEINQDREEGYVFALHGLSNFYMASHGENGQVFYLTLDVVETTCSVLSKKGYKECEVRDTTDTPVYGQCKVVIHINRVQRIVRLYNYNCVVRPVPASKVHDICPDCPSHTSMDHEDVQKTVSSSLEKFNKESGLVNHFALLNITRATSGMGVGMYYNVEYTIQETICARGAEAADKCAHMDCEFAHKGFCKGSQYPTPTGETVVDVECEIYEPEASHREKKLHQSGETDHSHSDAKPHTHDNTDATDHTHTHNHGHGHDHVHTHHAKAHDHTGDSPNHHHDYKHADGEHTHEHDHEIALDHDHKHAHLHAHEHHHHHHGHDQKTSAPEPEGTWTVLPAMDQPTTLPSFPDMPVAAAVTPGEPVLLPFPTAVSAECAPTAPAEGSTLVEKLFAEDPMFKPAA